VTGDTRRTLTRSWRKVRGKRWKALRTRLGELHDIAEIAHGEFPGSEPGAASELAAAGAALPGQPPETEPRALKH